MSISVGNYFITAHISNNNINEMCETKYIPHMSLWEKIKDFFFSTGQEEALKQLLKLCNPKPGMKYTEVKETFLTLERLAAPGYKKRFLNDKMSIAAKDTKDDDAPRIEQLQIKDDNGDDLLYVGKNGRPFYYNILGHSFIFNNYSQPDLNDKNNEPMCINTKTNINLTLFTQLK